MPILRFNGKTGQIEQVSSAPLWLGTQEARRIKMLDQALQNKAPQTYRNLKATGKLQQFLKTREQGMYEEFLAVSSELTEKAAQTKHPDHLTYEAALHEANRLAWNQAVENWTEFSDPEQTTEFQQAA